MRWLDVLNSVAGYEDKTASYSFGVGWADNYDDLNRQSGRPGNPAIRQTGNPADRRAGKPADWEAGKPDSLWVVQEWLVGDRNFVGFDATFIPDLEDVHAGRKVVGQVELIGRFTDRDRI